MKKILVSEDIRGRGIESLREKYSVIEEPDLWKDMNAMSVAVRECAALLVRNQTGVTGEVISSAPDLKVIGRAGAGLDNINLGAAREAGVTVVYTPGQNARSVGEQILGFMIALARNLVPAHGHVISGGWDRHRFSGTELGGKVLGLAGLGATGREAARLAAAMGMEVIASPSRSGSDGGPWNILPFDEMLGRADFVSCHYRLTPETMKRFGEREFRIMKDGAFFINTSRGEMVDEDALEKALKEGIIAGAALDVRETEPPGDTRFRGMENVILTPHTAAFTRDAQERVVDTVCRDMDAVLEGREPAFPCN